MILILELLGHFIGLVNFPSALLALGRGHGLQGFKKAAFANYRAPYKLLLPIILPRDQMEVMSISALASNARAAWIDRFE